MNKILDFNTKISKFNNEFKNELVNTNDNSEGFLF